MDLLFLRSFVAVADTGSLAAAAREIGVTPAAIAQRIRSLEADVGVPLLLRAGRRMQPTAGGRAILEPGRDLLRRADVLRTLAAGPELAGVLRIGAISTALTGLLPAVLKRFMARAPMVEVYLIPGSSSDLFRSLTAEQIDAAILIEPQFTMPKTLGWQSMRDEALVVLARRELADRDPKDLLRNEPLIRYDRNNWGGRLADGYLRQSGIRPRERLELDSLEAIAVMVSEGLGVALVPDWARPWPEHLAIVKLALEPSAPRRRIGLVWPRSSYKQALLDVFIEVVGRNPRGRLGDADVPAIGEADERRTN